MVNYYKRIKDCREDRDLKQYEVAEFLKISRGAYSMYECGSNIIPLKLLDKLSVKYQVSVDYLVGLSNSIPKYKIKAMKINLLKSRLKMERKKRNLSQNQIAEKLNITQSHYATYENGRNIIPIPKLITLSKFYKVSTDYLMGKVD